MPQAAADRYQKKIVHVDPAIQSTCTILNADKHSLTSCARSSKPRVRGCLCQWELKAPTDRSRSDCVHEQVAKRIANVRFTPLTNDHCLTSCAGSDELHWCLDVFLNEVNICLCILWKIFKGLASGQIAKVTIKLFIYWFAVL